MFKFNLDASIVLTSVLTVALRSMIALTVTFISNTDGRNNSSNNSMVWQRLLKITRDLDVKSQKKKFGYS